jgi:hypothetical protein
MSKRCNALGVPLVVAMGVADGQVLEMAVAAFAQGLDVLERGVGWRHVLAAHPAWHYAMQLAGHGFVDFVAGQAQFAHGVANGGGVV